MKSLNEILFYAFFGMAGWIVFGLAWTFLYKSYLKRTAEKLEIEYKRSMTNMNKEFESILKNGREMGEKFKEHVDSIEEDDDRKVVH